MCFCLSNSVVSSLRPPGKYHQMKYSFSPQTFLMYYLDVAQIEEDKICLFMLLLCCESHSVVSNSLWPHGLHSGWNSPGQNSGVGSLSLLQGIFPTQGSKPGLPHCGWILYQLNHKGSPRILEWVAYPFSRGSVRPRNRTGIFCIAGGFFTNWAIREARSRGTF